MVKFSDLGISQNVEPDRFKVDKRGAMSITKMYIDIKTKWYEKGSDTKRGILKFNGVDTATGSEVKYFTTSVVLIKQLEDAADVIGVKHIVDEQKIQWVHFNEPLEIGGIEMISTGIKGHNPYPKIV
jgi:hypothetical protein